MTAPIGSAGGAIPMLPTTYVPPTNRPGSNPSTGEPLLDPQAFLQLLVAQLQYQDPTNPVDTSNFMNQTAMLSQVQTITAMSSQLAEMVTAQQTQAATALIGRQVTFLDPQGTLTSGVVSAVSVHSGISMLHVGDLAVPMSGVLEVTDPLAAGHPGPPAGGTAGTDSGTDAPTPGATPPDEPAAADD